MPRSKRDVGHHSPNLQRFALAATSTSSIVRAPSTATRCPPSLRSTRCRSSSRPAERPPSRPRRSDALPTCHLRLLPLAARCHDDGRARAIARDPARVVRILREVPRGTWHAVWRPLMLRRPVLASLGLAAALASPATARAQDASTPTDAENVTTVQVPTRVLTINGVQTSDPGNLRPSGLNPTGVSYSDCEEDLELDFSMLISGFAAIDNAHIEMWAGTVDCTQDGNRTTTGVAHPCWKVAANTSTQVA